MSSFDSTAMVAESGTGVMGQQHPMSTTLINDISSEGGMQDAADEARGLFPGSVRSAMADLFRALSEALPDEPGCAAEFLRRAGTMLEGVGPRADPAVHVATPHGLAPWQVRRVLSYIDANLEKSIRNKDLADLVRRSEFHFNVAFRKSVGDSPHEYIIRRRIERAQGLMLSTDTPLSEIAGECGLADQAHLTRLFRRVVGETPAAWRRARANPKF